MPTKNLSLNQYIDGIKSGNRTILSKAITLIESQNPDHKKLSQLIVEKCLPLSGNSIRLGVSGIPGVGKSTFIEALGLNLVNKYNKKVAVLAIDPSSQNSKGSILGDKMRMANLSSHENAYIRPTPSSGSLGGVARKTRESIILCEAAGFDTIIIETMGVGQSEFTVNSMIDYFLLLLVSGTGDEIQGIKRGIMEIADGFVINKTDGNNIQNSKLAKIELENAIKLFPQKPSKWQAKVFTCSSINQEGIEEIWSDISKYKEKTIKNDYFNNNRKNQAISWLHQTIKDSLQKSFYENKAVKKIIEDIEKNVIEGKTNSYSGAEKLLSEYFKKPV